MTTTQQILDQLNTYEFDHTPETENIWQDVISGLDVDDEATAAADPSGASDRFVLTDGREFRWERSYERGRRWLDDSPAITAEIVDVNDIVVVATMDREALYQCVLDDREASFDTVEVRRGDVVLATIRVESSEDEAPYAAAVAEFGDVTWL